jgi:hypothetical protein
VRPDTINSTVLLVNLVPLLCAVCTCATAAKALEQLRDKSHNFDLVLSDVYMPGERQRHYRELRAAVPPAVPPAAAGGCFCASACSLNPTPATRIRHTGTRRFEADSYICVGCLLFSAIQTSTSLVPSHCVVVSVCHSVTLSLFCRHGWFQAAGSNRP